MTLTVIAITIVMASVVVAGVAFVVWQTLHGTSRLVHRWHPSSFSRRVVGPLSVLDSGPTGREDEEVVILLHGLGATGNYFGAFYDGLSRRRRVVIADLLGFGHSLDEQRVDFTVDDHVAALDQTLESLGLEGAPVVLGAHSMSSALALTWADRHPSQVRHVFLWGPPIHRSQDEARSIGREYGSMGHLFLMDTKWAERACRLNCAHRDVGGRMMAAMAPRWPIEVSSQASRHTWEAYAGSLRSLVLEFDWSAVLPARVPVTIFRGTEDPIGDADEIERLAGDARIVDVPGADHHVALEHPELLFDALADAA
jgi:pimeloyl-ACP methyl ester carboxylesterase